MPLLQIHPIVLTWRAYTCRFQRKWCNILTISFIIFHYYAFSSFSICYPTKLYRMSFLATPPPTPTNLEQSLTVNTMTSQSMVMSKNGLKGGGYREKRNKRIVEWKKLHREEIARCWSRSRRHKFRQKVGCKNINNWTCCNKQPLSWAVETMKTWACKDDSRQKGKGTVSEVHVVNLSVYDHLWWMS